jgi:hypothetical protein
VLIWFRLTRLFIRRKYSAPINCQSKEQFDFFEQFLMVVSLIVTVYINSATTGTPPDGTKARGATVGRVKWDVAQGPLAERSKVPSQDCLLALGIR